MTSFNAIVMAAGKGTRMRSETPKVLHELCGRSLVAWPVLAAQEAGAERVVVVRAPDIPLASGLPDGTLEAIQTTQDGTGGAVAAGLPALDGSTLPIVVLSGDVPLVPAAVIAELVAAHLAAGTPATMATTVLDDPTGYGRVVRTEDGRVARVVETKADGDATAAELAIPEVNTGIFCCDAAALANALPQIATDNAQGELYLPDILTVFAAAGTPAAAHLVTDPALVLGINDRVQLAAVRTAAQRRILEAHMLAGVTVIDPSATTVDVGVTIGQDTVLEPGTHLRGATVVGAGVTIGPNVVVVDAVIEDGANVGPFAYLRPGTVVRRGAKIGTFVEVKNSDIGEGAKVPHLSYIGDADVGAGTNLGAVTITANYNGRTKKKSRSAIGRNVRTGVLTALVAPVSLGDGAYTGAGSVIVDDVPEGALGIARTPQKTIPGYGEE